MEKIIKIQGKWRWENPGVPSGGGGGELCGGDVVSSPTAQFKFGLSLL